MEPLFIGVIFAGIASISSSVKQTVNEMDEVAVEEEKVEKKTKEHKKFGDRLRRGIDFIGKKLVDGLDMNDEN